MPDLKNWLGSLSIRHKLTLLASVSSATALLTAGVVLSLIDYHAGRHALIDRLQTQAQITARNSAAAVAFEDAEAAERLLEALWADDAVVAAEILRGDGSLLARHGSPEARHTGRDEPLHNRHSAPLPGHVHTHAEDNGLIHVGARVMLDGEVGMVNLWADTSEISTAMLRHGLVLLGAIVLALALATLAVTWLQRLVSEPLVKLSATTARVSRTRDYSLRVANERRDEIGQLITSFNDMLEQIEQRDRQLLGYHAELEREVEARTQELKSALAEAQTAARVKAEFLANMSHEIRTPMNGVIGMLELINGEKFDRDQRAMLETARHSADALLTLINDILDFSKLDAGKLSLETVEVELRPLVEDVATLFSKQARARGVEVTCAVHQDVPRVMLTDPTRLRQILANLIGNAVKFTERGEVFMGLLARAHEARGEVLPIQIVIRDTGIGMGDGARARLFEAFTQADGSTTRKYGGTGLGLAITKRLVDAMGGTIKVGSELGRGSTFSVILPLRVATGRAVHKLADLRGLRALIVDDNSTNRCVLEHYLTAFGMQHESAESAASGLQAAHAAAKAGRPFDLIVLDYQMPHMDGLGFLEALRADDALKATACIVLSSLGDRAARAQGLNVAAWLNKPVRQGQLQTMLATVAGRGTAPQEPTQREPVREETFHCARVLLVEDNRVNQEVARRLLRTFGINPALASNGAEALTAVRADSFDLILMDCQMPVMDGYEATQALRAWEAERVAAKANPRVPIVAMTANALEGDREECLEAGMDDYISKPIRRDVLASVLKRWLPARCSSTPAAQITVQEPESATGSAAS